LYSFRKSSKKIAASKGIFIHQNTIAANYAPSPEMSVGENEDNL